MKNKQDSREKILKASIELFSKEGYHASKITKIADMTGVSVGMIYLKFENKEKILEEIFLNAWTEIDNQLKDLLLQDISNINRIQKICYYLADKVSENNNLTKLILQEHLFWNSTENIALNEVVQSVFNSTNRIITLGVLNKDFRDDVVPEIVTSSIIGSAWNILEFWTKNLDKFTKEDISEQISKLIINSIKNK